MAQQYNYLADLAQLIERDVHLALAEDVRAGDLTAALIPGERTGSARVITRQPAVICGQPWFNAVFKAVDPTATLVWQVAEGEPVMADQVLVQITGSARGLLTAERTALNFLQTLSAVATQTARYVAAVAGTRARVLDTRKTLPGLRYALKYAVTQGGGVNQRVGLYDGILIKENHIMAAGGVAAALAAAFASVAESGQANVSIQIEVEQLEQLRAALAAGCRLILLDNFSPERMREAVTLTEQLAPDAQLEASGGITLATIRSYAETGVHRISVGALTKDIQAVDLSMRFTMGMA